MMPSPSQVGNRIKQFKILWGTDRSVLFDKESMKIQFLSQGLDDSLDRLIQNLDLLPGDAKLWEQIQTITNKLTGIDVAKLPPSNTTNATDDPADDPCGRPETPRSHILPKLALSITNDCNLACKYCYANKGQYGSGEKGPMRPDDVELTLRRFAERYEVIRSIQFMGGEPSLNPEAMERAEIVGQQLVNEGKLKKPPKLTMVTNGAHFSERFWEIVKQYKCQMTFSLDGPKEIHDFVRVKQGGGGSFEKIRENIKKAQEAGLSIDFEATFSKRHLDCNMSLIDLCQWFFDEYKIRYLHAPAMNENKYAINTQLGLTLDEKIQEYCAACEWGIQNLAKGIFLMNGFGHRIWSNLKAKSRNWQLCPAGTGQLAVACNGDVSPCWMFTDCKSLYMGNTHKEDFLGLKGLAVFKTMVSNDLGHHPACISCWASPFCSGCMGADYFSTGFIDKRTDCELMQAMVETVIMTVADLFEKKTHV